MIVHARTLILIAMFLLLLSWRGEQPRSGEAGWLDGQVKKPV